MKVSPLPNSLKQMIEKDIEICNQFIKKALWHSLWVKSVKKGRFTFYLKRNSVF